MTDDDSPMSRAEFEQLRDEVMDHSLQVGAERARLQIAADRLVKKAANLVALLDDAEVNHGGLWSGRTMRARDELRQELSRWSK